MADEISIYRDESIQVTNLRAMLHGKTYAMANVTSVSMYTQVNSKLPGIAIAIVGCLLSLMGLASRELAGCVLFFALSLVVIGIAYANSQKDRYWVRIGSSSGEANALSSTDREYVLRVVNAMNEAIVRRG